jgi:aryl-alcohol dehydrogenase-like predicted oxidoreductase
MEKRTLGNAGILVTPLGYGTAVLAGQPKEAALFDEAQSAAVVACVR